uniref:tetratricopeptide repeat protein n=1 Tax=Clavibacter michiganensis TaxID=28447 RepID=UPI00292E9DB5
MSDDRDPGRTDGPHPDEPRGGDPAAEEPAAAGPAAERPAADPRALFALDCAHDFVGREAEAVPLYRAAFDGGLCPGHRALVGIQLACCTLTVGAEGRAG